MPAPSPPNRRGSRGARTLAAGAAATGLAKPPCPGRGPGRLSGLAGRLPARAARGKPCRGAADLLSSSPFQLPPLTQPPRLGLPDHTDTAHFPTCPHFLTLSLSLSLPLSPSLAIPLSLSLSLSLSLLPFSRSPPRSLCLSVSSSLRRSSAPPPLGLFDSLSTGAPFLYLRFSPSLVAPALRRSVSLSTDSVGLPFSCFQPSLSLSLSLSPSHAASPPPSSSCLRLPPAHSLVRCQSGSLLQVSRRSSRPLRLHRHAEQGDPPPDSPAAGSGIGQPQRPGKRTAAARRLAGSSPAPPPIALRSPPLLSVTRPGSSPLRRLSLICTPLGPAWRRPPSALPLAHIVLEHYASLPPHPPCSRWPRLSPQTPGGARGRHLPDQSPAGI